ncbi:MAG TPA: TonB-dependent receptor plug domain-containing protein [Polyangia bacterium]|nr:TonB-dependent receptor plug domain-containing protein [Polyangia bacterium]
MSVRLPAAIALALGAVARVAVAAAAPAPPGDAGAAADMSGGGDAQEDARDGGARSASDGQAIAAPGDAATTTPERPVAGAATVPLRGRLLEKGTRKPLSGAAIAIDGVVIAETDAEGRFQVAVSVGSHDVAVKLAGQEIVHQQVAVQADAPLEEQVFRVLTPGSGAEYVTTVRAARPEIPKFEISGEEARQLPGSSGDPLRVLGSLPGVTQVAWPTALFVVRGANPGNTGFFLDGIRVPELFHLGLELSVINPYLIDGVDFYPGGSPANYGPYVSGIMAVRTTAPPADRVHASADVTVFDAGGIVTAPWDGGRGTVVVAARYSYTGELFTLLQNDTILRYGDYQVRIDHPWAGGQATLFAFGSLDDIGWTNVSNAAEYGALQFHRIDLRWRRAIGGGRLLLGVTSGADWANSSLFDSAIKVRALSAAPRFVYTRPLGAAVDLELGANANAQTFATHVPAFQRKQSDLGRSRQALSQAAYATVSVRVGNRLVISPALRADLFAEESTTAVYLEPRLDALVNLTDTVALRIDGGRYAQMPSLPVSVPGFEAFGLADLGAQTSLGGSLGVEAHLPEQLTLGVTGYYQKLRLTDVRNIDLEQNDPTAPDFLVSRDGRAYGAELMLRRNVGRLYGWLAYTLSWSQRYDDDGVLGRSDWDERHILNLVAGYRLGHATTVGARFHLNTGRWAPVVGSGGDYQELPAFYEIDLHAGRRFVFDRFVMDVYADFANVTLDPEVLQLDAVYGSGNMAVAQDRIKLVLPTIGLHAQF